MTWCKCALSGPFSERWLETVVSTWPKLINDYTDTASRTLHDTSSACNMHIVLHSLLSAAFVCLFCCIVAEKLWCLWNLIILHTMSSLLSSNFSHTCHWKDAVSTRQTETRTDRLIDWFIQFYLNTEHTDRQARHKKSLRRKSKLDFNLNQI